MVATSATASEQLAMRAPLMTSGHASRWLMWLSALALVALFVLLTAWGWQQRSGQWQDFLHSQAEQHRHAVLQARAGLEQQALLLAGQLAADPHIRQGIIALAEQIERSGIDDAAVREQRQALQAYLQPQWDVLRKRGANQLHVHLAPGVISLLRMHRPLKWQDRLDTIRPLVDQVQQTGQASYGLEVGRHGSGVRGVVPIHAGPDADRVIASLEVGFGMLPELRQLDQALDSGLALLLHAPLLTDVIEDFPRAGLTRAPEQPWLLDQHSRREVIHWQAQGMLPPPTQQSQHQILQAGQHSFLLTQIPLRDVAGRIDPARPAAAAALVWKNIDLELADHRQQMQLLILRWLLALLAALGLLLLLLYGMRRVVDAQYQKFSQRLLDQSEQRNALLARFHKLARHLPGVVYQFQLEPDGRSWFPFSSAAIEDIYGITPEQAAGSAQLVFDAIHPDDLGSVTTSIMASAKQLQDWQANYRVRHPKRGTIWVAGRATPERLDSGGTVWHGFITDITEARTRSEQTREARAFLRAVIDAATEIAIITTDAQGTINLFNPGAERLLGYSADELVGKHSPVCFHLRSELEQRFNELFRRPPAEHELMQVFSQPAAHGRVQSRVWSYLRKDGEIRQVQLSVTPISGEDGDMHGLLGMATDITEQLRTETLKNEFIATVNHELRTPLTSIIGAIGLLNGGALGQAPEPMQRLLQIAEQNTRQLNALINDLLDLDKLSAGQVHFDTQWLPLEPALQQAISANQGYAERYQVQLRLQQPVPAVEVAADPRRLAQVLANLLSNACKFSPPGECVELAARWDDDNLQISVTDHGSGIAEEFHPQIFRRFAQADSSSTRKHGGTGLGLAISRELVQQMGGSIDFASTAGAGACFWFSLPAQPAKPA